MWEGRSRITAPLRRVLTMARERGDRFAATSPLSGPAGGSLRPPLRYPASRLSPGDAELLDYIYGKSTPAPSAECTTACG